MAETTISSTFFREEPVGLGLILMLMIHVLLGCLKVLVVVLPIDVRKDLDN